MRKALPLFFLAGLALVSCNTVPTSISTDLSPQEYFRTAQTYSDRGNYLAAQFYYETFIQRFPNDKPHIAEAQYEIAFIQYKLKDYAKSKQLFEDLVNRYNGPGADALPRWPLVLSNKLIIEIDAKTHTPPPVAAPQPTVPQLAPPQAPGSLAPQPPPVAPGGPTS